MAHIVLILAEDMQLNGVTVDSEGRVTKNQEADSASEGAEAARAKPPPKKANKSRDRFLARTQDSITSSASATSTATLAGAQRLPSEMEKKCDPADLKAIRDVYGQRGQEIQP